MPRKGYRKPVDWGRVQAFYDTGVNQWAIVRRFGVSRTTIQKAATEGFLKLRLMPGRRGNKPISVLTPLQRSMRNMWCSYRVHAKKRKIHFGVSFETFQDLVMLDCWYCGGPPTSTWSKASRAPMFNGVDRVDNKRGYVKDNLVPCCGPCNRAKHTLSASEFIELATKVCSRHGAHACS
jgi:hypothetical protein